MVSTESRPTVVLAEDEPDIREMLHCELAPLELNLLEASDGEQALELIRTHSVDAVLTDISMPKMNGIELIRAIRQLEYHFPVIVLTAFADKTNTQEALRLGAFDFLEKPFQTQLLLQVVSRAVEEGKCLRQLERQTEGFAPLGPGLYEMAKMALKRNPSKKKS